MVYFKTELIEGMDGQSVETAIRKFAAKRHTSLDLQSSSTDIGTDKLFLGLENENNIRITRIRSSFEQLLPKLIIKFEKANGFTQYKIRYSVLSNVVFIIASSAIILNVIYSVKNGRFESNLATVFVFFFIFIFLSLIELRLTKSKLRRAINKITS